MRPLALRLAVVASALPLDWQPCLVFLARPVSGGFFVFIYLFLALDAESQPSVPIRTKLEAEHVYEIETPFGLGSLAPYQKERMAHQTRLRVFWRRAVIWVVVLVLGLWFGAAGALYCFVKYQRGFSEVRFKHMVLLPWKIGEYRRAKAEFTLHQGLAAAEAQQWAEAFYALRAALPLVPEHKEARMLVARVYLMAGRPDQAQTVLVEGIDYHRDQLDYLRTVLGFLFSQQADEAVVELTRALQARGSGDPAFVRMVMTAQAYAHFNRGRFREAEVVFTSKGLGSTPEARFVGARIAWERGRRGEALMRLRELHEQVPDDAEIHRTLVYYLSEDGRHAELRRLGLAGQLARPDRPEGYLDFLAGAAELGAAEDVAATEADYLRRFAKDRPALLRLAERAAAKGRAGTVATVSELLAKEDASERAAVTLLLAEAWLEAVKPEEVLAVPTASVEGNETHRLSLEGLRGVALARLGRLAEAEPLLWRVAESRRLPANTLVSLAGRLQQAGQAEMARRLLARAVEVDPLHQPALVAYLRDTAASGTWEDKGELVLRLAGMRKPPEDLLVEVEAAYRSDRFLFVVGREEIWRVVTRRLEELQAARG